MSIQNDYLQVYQGTDGRHYWRRRAGNGEIVATGAQGYESDAAARAAAQRNNPGIPIR